MELECEIYRKEPAVTLADGTPMCGKCHSQLKVEVNEKA